MAKDRYSRGKIENFRAFLLFLAFAAALALLFLFVIGFARVDGHSMDDSFINGELVLINRLDKSADRGDVVDILLPTGEYYIKRVVAVEGDVVDINGGVLYINGAPESGYDILGETLPESGAVTYPYTVPKGCVFIAGDNRPGSVDSRAFGAVNLAGLKGIVKLRIGWLYFKGV